MEANKLMQEQRDAEMWRMGLYVHDAVLSAIDKALNGRKSKAKYMDKPIFEQMKLQAHENEEGEPELSEDEKMRQVNALFMALNVRATNARLEKKEKESNQCQTET